MLEYQHQYIEIKAKICCERRVKQGAIETVVLVKPKNKNKTAVLTFERRGNRDIEDLEKKYEE